jgi:membrane associated rhomboid family serine protease
LLPIRDINPTKIVPVVNYSWILANVVAFLWAKSLPSWYEIGYALVPIRVLHDPPGEAFTIFTSMFLHADLWHLVGNLLFLYIFGDNVEEALGHGRYIGFYGLSGIAAGAAQIATNVASPIPMIGASGAIAGVTGAYMVLFPRAPIMVLNPIPPLWFIIGPFFVFPAWLVAGEFFVMNLFQGVQSLGGDTQGGVAFFAHLGGFVAGLALVRPLQRGATTRVRRNWDGWRPPPRRPGGRSGGSRRDPWV